MPVTIQSRASGRYITQPIHEGAWTSNPAEAHDFGTIRAADDYIREVFCEGNIINYPDMRRSVNILQNDQISEPDKTKLNPDGPTGQGW